MRAACAVPRGVDRVVRAARSKIVRVDSVARADSLVAPA